MISGLSEKAIKIRNWNLTGQAEPAADNVLVEEFIAGNDAAFTQLVTRYKDPIINYINTMVGNYDIAADLAQETFLRVYKNIGRYNSIYQFSTWIYRIAANLAIDEIRYRKRRGQVFYRNVWENQADGVTEEREFALRDSGRSPGDEVLRKESGQVVGDAIRSLPPKYRTAFVMKEIQELPYEEIARILKTSPGTIKSRLHRARELLQRKLEHYM
ncbi:MAG: sigma-70 family RNA polymerase sigma factor [Acidobacteriota bacterium]|nr:sigma-70 family RNA polymerase sigma factor [Acidobacteriota bacterium]